MRGRKFLACLFCFLLSLFLVGYIAIVMFDTVVDENIIKDVLKQKMKSEISEDAIKQLKSACVAGVISEIQFPVGEVNISLSCTDIIAKTPNEVSDFISEKIAKAYFYRNVTCEIPECLKEGKMSVLLSYKAKIFLQQFEIPFLILLFVCGFLVFIALKSFSSGAKSVGITILITTIPLFGLEFLTQKILSERLPEDFLFLKDIIIEKMASVHNLYFSISLVGAFLLISGFVYQKIKS